MDDSGNTDFTIRYLVNDPVTIGEDLTNLFVSKFGHNSTKVREF